MIGVIGWFLTLRSSCERLGGLYTLHPSKKDLGRLTSTRSLRFLHSAGLSSALSGALLGRVHLLAPFLVHFWGRVHFLAPFLVHFWGRVHFPAHFLGRAHFLAHFWLLFFCIFWRRREKSRTFGRFLFALFSLFFRFFFALSRKKQTNAKKKRKKSEKKTKKKRPKVRLFSRHH